MPGRTEAGWLAPLVKDPCYNPAVHAGGRPAGGGRHGASAVADGAAAVAPPTYQEEGRARPRPSGAPAAARAVLRAACGNGLGPVALVVGVVVLANVLYLAGVSTFDPMSSFADLGSVLHGGILSGQYEIDPNAGFTAQSLGHLAATDLLHLHLPWWDPYEGVGAPLAGEMQGAALFPGTLLLWFRDGQLWLHLLLEALSGLATMRLLERLGCGRWVAATLACAFALCGTFAWYAGQPGNEILFLPLLVLGIEHARQAASYGRRFGYVLIAVALALSVYAGFPETAYLDGLLAALWAVVRGAGVRRGARVRYAARLVAGTGAGVLLAAPAIVAFADYVPHAALGPHSGGVFDLVHMSHEAIAGLVFPYLFGPIFGFDASAHSVLLVNFWSQVGGYLTTSLLILDLLALWGRRHRALRVALLFWLVVALGRTYGLGPVWHTFDLLPFMGHVGAYRYLSPSVSFAAVVLAALGAEDVRRGDVPRLAAAGALLVAAGLGAAAALSGGPILASVSGIPGARAWAIGSLVWGFGILTLIGGGSVALRGRWRTAVVITCVVLDALGMYVVAELSAPRSVSYDAGLVAFLQRHDATGRFFTLGPMQANYGSYFGVPEADINDLPTPEAYHRYIEHRLDTNTPLQFTGTVMANPRGPSPLQELVAHFSSYEAIGVRDVIAFAGTVPSSIAASLHLREVYADGYAVVYATPHPAALYQASAGCTASASSIGSVTVRCTRPGVLVRREIFMPGWSAVTSRGAVLGVRSGSDPAPGLSQSVRVPAGTTTVTFSYLPPHENVALGALGAGALAVVLPVGSWGAQRRRAGYRRRARRRARRLRQDQGGWG